MFRNQVMLQLAKASQQFVALLKIHTDSASVSISAFECLNESISIHPATQPVLITVHLSQQEQSISPPSTSWMNPAVSCQKQPKEKYSLIENTEVANRLNNYIFSYVHIQPFRGCFEQNILLTNLELNYIVSFYYKELWNVIIIFFDNNLLKIWIYLQGEKQQSRAELIYRDVFMPTDEFSFMFKICTFLSG